MTNSMLTNKEPVKVLVIEDNEGDAFLVKELLERQKEQAFNVTSVNNIKEASEITKLNKFSVLILDLDLPDGKGFNTFTKAKEIVPDVPILILSGSTLKRDEFRKCLDGAKDYLVKGYLSSDSLAKSILNAIKS